MKTLLTFSIATILTINSANAFASCDPAVTLQVGDKVTDCTRVGLNMETAKQAQLDIIERDYLKKQLDETKKIIELKDLMITNQERQTDLWKADAMRERANYDKEKGRSETSFWIGMGAGFLTILAGAWAIKQVSK